MGSITLLVLTVILAAHINAYPQEAEILPSNVPRKSSTDIGYNAAQGRSFITPPEFFMRMFGGDYYYPPFHPARFIPPIPFHQFVLPPVVVPMIPFPDLSRLPDNYSNSTREVKTGNGQKVVINQKIDKSKDGNGFFVSHFHTFHSAPDDQGYNAPDDRARSTPDEKTLPNNDDQSRNWASSDIK